MPLEAHLRPWTARVFRHLPAHLAIDPLDLSRAGRGLTNRWNEAGDPTLYLAGDEGVLAAEWGRYLVTEIGGDLATAMVARVVYRIEIALAAVLDLRDPAALAALSISGAPACFLDRAVARATANFARRTTRADGLLVPSMALLDQPGRGNLVVFLDKLPPAPSAFIRRCEVVGPLQWPA
jgi:RES domain-containing protein